MDYQIENLKIAPINKKNSFVVVNHLHEQLFHKKRNLSFFIDCFRVNRKYYYILYEGYNEDIVNDYIKCLKNVDQPEYARHSLKQVIYPRIEPDWVIDYDFNQ